MAEDSTVLSSAHQCKNSGTFLAPCEYARYFLMNLTNPNVPNTSFTHVSPFLIHKALLSILGEVASVKKLRSGDLLVEVSSAKQATILSTCTTMCSFNITVTPHRSLNTSRGVISETEFINDTEDMILDNLQSQNVTSVRRIKIRRDGKLIPTKHLILTFASAKLPTEIKMAWINCPVRPYIPNPLRCYQCQRFGHSKTSCRGRPVCAHCSSTEHEDTSCELPPLCVNCKGDHAAYARSCPKWSQEKEIQSIKVLQNLTFNEARRIVTARTPRPGVSYSAAAKTSYRTVSTQTDSSISSTPQQTKQNPKFNFTGPSTSHRSVSKSPPPKTSRMTSPEKPRPALKQRPNIKLPPSLKPGIPKKNKDPKFIQIAKKSTSDILQKMDTEITLHPSDDESVFDDPPMDVTSKSKFKSKS
ncbi:uncharacterized protein [Parasteatoda tepidariorum]|uniref:uncharacterized protein n=1 Tax=Parasteatoda tepidariorum TaxID=114398 RepID=UPI001C71C376|nr:uncharacterized protein LOC122271964 [Parasteatoda tepidariorum]